MEYTNYQQGSVITLEGLKSFIRMTDDIHDAELEVILKQATTYVQEFLNKALVDCSVELLYEGGKEYRLMLSGFHNIQVVDMEGNEVPFTKRGHIILLEREQTVIIKYDCVVGGIIDRYAPFVYQVASATYDGQPNDIPAILKYYPVW